MALCSKIKARDAKQALIANFDHEAELLKEQTKDNTEDLLIARKRQHASDSGKLKFHTAEEKREYDNLISREDEARALYRLTRAGVIKSGPD